MNATTPNPKPVRGSNYTPNEDAALAKAWINISEDPIVGAEQKGDDFINEVTEVYNNKYKPSNRENRSVESIKKRCKVVNKACVSFAGCVARVRRMNPTGVSPDDFLNMATGLYNGFEMVNAREDSGVPFKFMLAWKVLCEHPKFMAQVEPMQKYVSSSNENDEENLTNRATVVEEEGGSREGKEKDNKDNRKRPIGRRMAKDMVRREELTRKKLRLAQKALDAQYARNKILLEHTEMMTFAQSPAGCSQSDSVEYFNLIRQRALRRVRDDEENEKKKKDVVHDVQDGEFSGDEDA